MTNDAVWSMLVAWIAVKTGQKVIRYRAGGVEPAEPYIAVNFLGDDPAMDWEQGIEYIEGVTIPPGETFPIVTATPHIEMEYRFSVHAYGPKCSDILRPIRSAIRLTQALEPIEPDLTIHEMGNINVLPEFVNEKWQDRAQMDIFVRGMMGDGFRVDVINVIPFTINGTAGTVNIDEG